MSEARPIETERLAGSVALGAFAAGYLATYFVTTAVPTPLLWYYPLQRRFELTVHPSGLAMDFMGRVLLSLGVGLVCGAVGRALTRNSSDAKLVRALRIVAVWTAVLLVFTASLYVYLLAGRHPVPAVLPPDYVPR